MWNSLIFYHSVIFDSVFRFSFCFRFRFRFQIPDAAVNNKGEEVNKRLRITENVAWHSEGNADNKRQRNRGTGDFNIRGPMIVLNCGKPKFISLPVSPPIYRSKPTKFHLCARSPTIIFMRTALPYLCFVFVFSKSGGRNNAKYAFQYTFNNNTTQYAKKKKKKRKNVWVRFKDRNHFSDF